jgi:hypothetical protein
MGYPRFQLGSHRQLVSTRTWGSLELLEEQDGIALYEVGP